MIRTGLGYLIFEEGAKGRTEVLAFSDGVDGRKSWLYVLYV